MLQFFISEHDLKDFNKIEKCVLKRIELIKSSYNFSIFFKNLSNLFDCEHYYNNSSVSFFGFNQDVELCCYFYNLIVKTCLKEKDVYIKTQEYLSIKKYHHGRTLISSFIKGFLVEVACKMNKMYEDRERNIPESYGLMVIEKKRTVSEEFIGLGTKIKLVKQKEMKFESIAFQSGIDSGKKVKLIQGIESCEESNLFSIGI
jgi:hypothetical protein